MVLPFAQSPPVVRKGGNLAFRATYCWEGMRTEGDKRADVEREQERSIASQGAREWRGREFNCNR